MVELQNKIIMRYEYILDLICQKALTVLAYNFSFGV